MLQRLAIYLILILAPLAVFGRVLQHDFVAWDDDVLVYENPHLHPVDIPTFWRGPYDRIYMPLTYTVYGVLAARDGGAATSPNTPRFDPRPFHAVNLALHLLNVLLLFALLRLVVRDEWAACLGALLFAVHPVQAEAVAWVSELKGMLSSCCTLTALLLYLRYARAAAGIAGERHCKLRYALATVALMLALLAKPSAVVVPLLALVLDIGIAGQPWKIALRSLSLWFVLALLWIPVTQYAQPVTDDAIRVAWWNRPFVAADALVFYLGKLVAPWGLVPDYGRTPGYLLAQGWRFGALLLVLALVLITWRSARRRRYVGVAALLFVVGLLPVLGFLPFHFQIYSTVADRYLYLAMLGPAFALGWALQRFPQLWWRAGSGAVIAVLAVLAAAQAGQWKDSVKLFEHTLRYNPASWMAHNNLGSYLLLSGRGAEAMKHLEAASTLSPQATDVHYNIGHAWELQGQPARAMTEYRLAIALDPRNAKAHNNLGALLYKQGQIEAAGREFKAALLADAQNVDARFNSGLVAEKEGNADAALRAYRLVLRAAPAHPKAAYRAGLVAARRGDKALAIGLLLRAIDNDPLLVEARTEVAPLIVEQDGRVDIAVDQMKRAAELRPNDPAIQYNLGLLLKRSGNLAGAADALRAAVRLKPTLAEAHNELGVALARLGKMQDGESHLRAALRLRPRYGEALYNLGVVLMGTGRRAEAILTWRRVLEIDPANEAARAALRQAEASLRR